MYKQLTAEIPNKVTVACSGGSDSLAALLFAWNHGKRDVTALYINHNDSEFSKKSENFVRTICECYKIKFRIESVYGNTEEEWSIARNIIYKNSPETIVVAHTLDDAVEWWLMRALRGRTPSLMQAEAHNAKVIRPFLLFDKNDMKSYIRNWITGANLVNREYTEFKEIIEDLGKSSPWMEDPTNTDGVSNMRSKMRVKLMPVVEEISDLKGIIANMYLKNITILKDIKLKKMCDTNEVKFATPV